MYTRYYYYVNYNTKTNTTIKTCSSPILELQQNTRYVSTNIKRIYVYQLLPDISHYSQASGNFPYGIILPCIKLIQLTQHYSGAIFRALQGITFATQEGMLSAIKCGIFQWCCELLAFQPPLHLTTPLHHSPIPFSP